MITPSRHKLATGGLPLLPRVNLIPAEIADRRALRRVQTGLGGAAVAAVAIVIVAFLAAATSVSSAKSDLAGAQAENAGAQTNVDGLKNVGQTFALVDQAHGTLRDAAGGEVLWSSYLTDLSLRVPDSVWLTKVSVAPATTTGGVAQISFEGVGLAHGDVAKWLDSIAKERGWTDPYFSRSEEKFIGTHRTYSFTSTVTVTSAALSGRYTKPAGS
ncbi:MAG: PilN domain-containing protein [Pseudonocardiales bacterium]